MRGRPVGTPGGPKVHRQRILPHFATREPSFVAPAFADGPQSATLQASNNDR